jgi:hypothetical protein
MDEQARMIAAARRLARRIAKKTELTYQQALDQVARDLGRDHWAAYAADPVAVPRDIPPADRSTEMEDQAAFLEASFSNDVSMDSKGAAVLKGLLSTPVGRYLTFPEVLIAGVDWNVPASARSEDMLGLRFVPGWNVLADRFVGRHVPDEDREGHVAEIALALIPAFRKGGDRYFDDKGRESLEALLLVEVFRAWREGREASIPALVDWIGDDMHAFGRIAEERNVASARAKELPRADGLGIMFSSMCQDLLDEDRSERARRILRPLVDMAAKERSGVLGTMDQALLPFKNREIKAMNR